MCDKFDYFGPQCDKGFIQLYYLKKETDDSNNRIYYIDIDGNNNNNKYFPNIRYYCSDFFTLLGCIGLLFWVPIPTYFMYNAGNIGPAITFCISSYFFSLLWILIASYCINGKKICSLDELELDKYILRKPEISIHEIPKDSDIDFVHKWWKEDLDKYINRLSDADKNINIV